MNSNIDEFIKDICDGECGEYFVSSRAYCFALIKEALPSDIFSQKVFDRELQIKIARIALPLIKKNNKIDKNRFWILYYRLAERLILMKCSECKHPNQSIMCEEYILDRILKYIKKFDINVESTPFQEVKTFIKNGDYDGDLKRAGATGNYIKKIVTRYNEASIDRDTANALIENAMINIDKRVIYQKDFSEAKINLKNEISKRLNHDKGEIATLLYHLLIELLHEEKFFNYINNYVIKNRFIDFVRRATIPDIEHLPEPDPSIGLDEILAEYLEMIPVEIQLILRLKIGERLNNADFIKLTYLFDYREIDIFEKFTDDEYLKIKFYARNNIDTLKDIDKKISEIREKLESNSYINKTEDESFIIFLKLIYPEPLKSKEIGSVLGYTEKQINKKIENIKKRINYKKDLTLCKVM